MERDDDRALGRSRGGFSTKIHVVVVALGNPVEFLPTGGPEADVTQAEPLMRGHGAGASIADEAHGSDAVVAASRGQGAEAVIPSKTNRKVPREHDEQLHENARRSSGSSAC